MTELLTFPELRLKLEALKEGILYTAASIAPPSPKSAPFAPILPVRYSFYRLLLIMQFPLTSIYLESEHENGSKVQLGSSLGSDLVVRE